MLTDDGGQMPSMVELRMKARPENLALARLALAGFATTAGPPDDVIADLKVAVTEACTNAIQHAGAGCGADDDIVVRYTIDSGALLVGVEDFGDGFEGAGVTVKADPFHVGPGLGLRIIRDLSDELSIESGASGSRVVFSRHLRNAR